MSTNSINEIYREQLTHCQRIVVKIGTRLLVNSKGLLDERRITHLVDDIADLFKQGKQVVFVSSGAVGAGLKVVGMKHRPTEIKDLQMAAAVGQTRLINCYYQLFAKNQCNISQVLLTHADLKHRQRHLNARNTMLNLLDHRIIPIVNENDVVTVDELRFGDNDMLSALVSALIDADLLIILTSPNGLRQFLATGSTKRISYVEEINEEILTLIQPKTDKLSLGGMSSKLQATELALRTGTQVIIASGKQPGILAQIIQGKDVGTLFGNYQQSAGLQKRKRWISYFHRPQGSIVVDEGAQKALQQGGKSLLPSGIKQVEGNFSVGSLVLIKALNGELIGHGLSEYNHQEIEKIMGKHSKEIANLIVSSGREEVIHRNNMVIFKSNKENSG